MSGRWREQLGHESLDFQEISGSLGQERGLDRTSWILSSSRNKEGPKEDQINKGTHLEGNCYVCGCSR